MKINWRGEITSVQPRFRLTRSFDQRYHSYLGYGLRIRGEINEREGEAWFGVGKGAHQKNQFRVGQVASGQAQPVANPRLEPVDFYKITRLSVDRGSEIQDSPPPWHGVPPPIDDYRDRRERRLSARTYSASCSSCIWGARMPVEMIIDQWNPHQKRYRFETFCYGPKSCRFYKAGPTRKVPGRSGMTYEEEDWVDKELTAHRGPDD